MLAAGAFVGLVVALVGMTYVEGRVSGDVRHLARFAFVLSPALFVLWWLGFHGLAVDKGLAVGADGAAAAGDRPSIDERIAKIIATFDNAAVPRPTRAPQPEDPSVRDTLLRSVRRNLDAVVLEDPTSSFGLRKRVAGDAPLADEA
ncbi:MAG: hypothetical protein JWM86_1326 [Thermoleophilia bacterium]|nr:hypothetical protein [Thermoleophilia bacterium]